MFCNTTLSNLGPTVLLVLLALWLASCGKEPTAPDEPPALVIELSAEDTVVPVGSEQVITAEVIGSAGEDSAIVTWEVSHGDFESISDFEISWTAPEDTLQAEISVEVKQGEASGSGSIQLFVGNTPPGITLLSSSSDHVLIGNSISIDCQASDPEGFPLAYAFYTIPDSGMLVHSSPAAATATWTAPAEEQYEARNYTLIAEVTDHLGLTAVDTIAVLVYSDDESIWVVDSGLNRVTKYTANGMKVLEAEELFLNPVAVAANVEEFYGCYVADYDAATVFKIDEEGRTMVSYANIPTVIDLGVHRETRTIWALSAGGGAVSVIDGFQDVLIKTIYGFFHPQFVHINQATGDVWIAEPGNNRVIQLDATMSPDALPDTISDANASLFPASGEQSFFNAPYSPFVRSQAGQTLYIADKSDEEIERLEWNGGSYVRSNSPLTLATGEPRFVTVTEVEGMGAAVLIMAFDGRLTLFPESNPLDAALVSGDYLFDVPHAMTLNESTGEYWIGDNGSNQLVKIRLNGDHTFTILSEISGFVFIDDVVLNR